MAKVTGTNVAGHFPIGDPIGASHAPPVVAGAPRVTYTVPAPNTLTINGVVTPKIDVRMHALSNIVDFVNGVVAAGVTASINRYGQLDMFHPVGITVGGDATLRAALGI